MIEPDLYTVAIETEPGFEIRAPPPEGMSIDTAREVAAMEFSLRRTHNRPIVAIGIFQATRLIDTFDGRWSSEFPEA